MTDHPTVRAHYNDEGLTITPLNPASGVATRNHKGSQDPNSSLAASSETGVTFYLRRLREDRERNLEKAVPFVVEHLVALAPSYNWRSSRDAYKRVAKIAIKKFLGEQFTYKSLARELEVSVDAVRCHNDKIDEALIYLMRMDRD